MSESDPILAKADALMRRHRVFVARSNEAEATPSAITVEPSPAGSPIDPPADEEIPLLTDIVDQVAGEGLLVARTALAAGVSPDAVQRWIDEELPATVLAVLDGVTDKLVEVLTARIKRDLIDPARGQQAGD